MATETEATHYRVLSPMRHLGVDLQPGALVPAAELEADELQVLVSAGILSPAPPGSRSEAPAAAAAAAAADAAASAATGYRVISPVRYRGEKHLSGHVFEAGELPPEDEQALLASNVIEPVYAAAEAPAAAAAPPAPPAASGGGGEELSPREAAFLKTAQAMLAEDPHQADDALWTKDLLPDLRVLNSRAGGEFIFNATERGDYWKRLVLDKAAEAAAGEDGA